MNNSAQSLMIATLLLVLLAANAKRSPLARQRAMIRTGRAPLSPRVPALIGAAYSFAMRPSTALRQRHTHIDGVQAHLSWRRPFPDLRLWPEKERRVGK